MTAPERCVTTQESTPLSTSANTLASKLRAKKLEAKLGFEPVDFSTLYFPKYVFKYVSPGGNTGTKYDVVMDIDNPVSYTHLTLPTIA